MNDNKIRQIIPIIADSNGWIWINNSYSTSQHCQLNEHHDMFLPFFGAVFWSPILAKELIKLGIQAIGESTQWLLCANITCLSFWSVLPSAQMRLGLKMDKKKTSKKKVYPQNANFRMGKMIHHQLLGYFQTEPGVDGKNARAWWGFMSQSRMIHRTNDATPRHWCGARYVYRWWCQYSLMRLNDCHDIEKNY